MIDIGFFHYLYLFPGKKCVQLAKAGNILVVALLAELSCFTKSTQQNRLATVGDGSSAPVSL